MQEGRLTTATVLVCDLVGSTAQRTTLGDDAADRLAVLLDRLFRESVRPSPRFRRQEHG